MEPPPRFLGLSRNGEFPFRRQYSDDAIPMTIHQAVDLELTQPGNRPQRNADSHPETPILIRGETSVVPCASRQVHEFEDEGQCSDAVFNPRKEARSTNMHDGPRWPRIGTHPQTCVRLRRRCDQNDRQSHRQAPSESRSDNPSRSSHDPPFQLETLVSLRPWVRCVKVDSALVGKRAGWRARPRGQRPFAAALQIGHGVGRERSGMYFEPQTD